MSKAKIRKILLKAADIVQERGLCKGKFGASDGRVCSLGAVRCAMTGSPVQTGDWDLYVAVTRHLEGVLGVSWVPDWNDRRRRRKHEVVAKLRKAAELV